MLRWSEFINENISNKSKLDEETYNKIDFYYLDYDVDLSLVERFEDMFEDNVYRAFATFAENIEHFKSIKSYKIAIINYPPERYNKRTLVNKINEVKDKGVDEIEFPWNRKYMKWTKDEWRDIIIDCSSHGIILRPMLDIAVQSKEDVLEIFNFFKLIGINSVVTSSGLIPEITTFSKWDDIKDIVPAMFEVKVGGILTINDINEYIKSDADLVATTIELKVNYDSNDIDLLFDN